MIDTSSYEDSSKDDGSSNQLILDSEHGVSHDISELVINYQLIPDYKSLMNALSSSFGIGGILAVRTGSRMVKVSDLTKDGGKNIKYNRFKGTWDDDIVSIATNKLLYFVPNIRSITGDPKVQG